MKQRFLVYFFATINDEFVKIGYAMSNLYRRMEQLQVGCPIPIKLVGIITCEDKSEMLKYERAIHNNFQVHNTVGEWFRLVPEISDYIEDSTELGKDVLESDSIAYRKKERKRQSVREYDPEQAREYRRQYRQRPEVKERRREEKRRYRQKPENKEKDRKRKQTAAYKEKQRLYRQRPEVKERKREYQREYQELQREHDKCHK